MSKQVDERVVSMEFDNSRFEKNVSTTMSTLDKLKQKLNLDGAAKGLEDVNAAAAKVNMSGLGSGIDAVKAKFSALDVVAVTALANITNKAVDAGEKLAKSLSIDQITTGWQKFADKTTSVATLVAQGNAIEDVNDQLDRLNWFTDETSYNFTEMVSNIAKFTATGKNLEESVNAMEGIATWAAVSGQNASTASRAMYQLSQALSAGYMRKEDWKSIQNASMDTDEFRQKTLDAAVALKTLQKNADGTYTSLVSDAKSATNFTKTQFVDSLTEGAWFTSDVMMTVYQQYASAVDSIYDVTADSGRLASDVIDEIHDKADELKTDVMTDEEAIDAAIRELGYTLEDGSLKFDSFALKTFEAAQKARTFTDAIDSVKDAVSTGWMNTFQLIFGDAEKATELWTDLANTLYDVFAAGGEIRNWILEIALNFTKPWNKIMDKLEGTGFGKVKDLANSIGDATEKLEYFQDIVNKVWRGDFNNRGDNPDRFDLLTKAGYDPRVVQTLVNKGYQYKLTVEDIEAAHKEFGLTLETTAEETEEVTSALEKLTDEQLKNAGLSEEEIALYKAMQKEADRLGISISDLADEMSEVDGRTLLIDSFKNLGSILLDIASIAKEAWKTIFNPPGAEEVAVRLYGIIKSLNEFTESIRLTNKETGELTEAGKKFQRIFNGVFAVVDIITDIIGGALSAAFEILKEIFGDTNTSILDVGASIGDSLVVFRDLVTESNLITDAFNALVNVAKKVIRAVKSWIKAFKDIPVVSKLIEDIKQLFSDINSDANEGTDNIKNWVNSFDGLKVIGKILDKIGEAFEWIGGVVEKAITTIGAWFETLKQTEAVQHLITGVTDLIDAFSKLFSGELDASEFATALGKALGEIVASIPEMAIQIGKDFIAGFSIGLTEGISEVIGDILEFCGNFISAFLKGLGEHSPSVIAEEAGVNWVQGFINGILSMLEPLITAIQPIIDFVKDVFTSFWGYITDESGKIEWDKIAAGGITISSLVILNKFAEAFQNLSKSMTSFTDIFAAAKGVLTQLKTTTAQVGKAAKWDLTANAVMKMAIAVGIFAAAVFALSKIDDIGKLWNAVGVIFVLAAIVAGLAFVMSKLGDASIQFSAAEKKLDINGMKTTILQLGIALLLLAVAVKTIGGMKPEEATQGLKGLLIMIGGMIVFMAVMGGISRYTKDVADFGKLMTKMAWAMLLMVGVIKMVNWLSGNEMAKGTAFMAGFALFVIAIGRVARSAGNNVSKFGSMVIKLAIAMGLLVGVCKLVNSLSAEEALKGAAFAAAFVLLVRSLVKAVTIGKKQQMGEVGGVILATGAAMLLMAAACKIVASLSLGDIIKGLACITVFGLIIDGLIQGLKVRGEQQMGKVGASLVGAAMAILIMAGTAVVLSMIPLEDLWKGVAIVAVFGLIMSAMAKSLKGANEARYSIQAMAVCIAVMAAAVVALSFLDEGDLIRCSAAMAVMMGMFALMVSSLKGLEKGKVPVGSLYALMGVIFILAGIVALLSYAIKDFKSAIGATIALSAVILAMGLMLKNVHKIGYSKYDSQKIWNLTAMAVPLLAFAAIIGGLSIALSATKSSIAASTIIGLLAVMAAMVLLLKLLHSINYSQNDTKKVWNLTAMAVPLLAFAAIIGGLSIALSATKSSIAASTIIGLLAVMLAMVGLLAVLNLIKVDGKSITKSIIAFTAMAVPLVAFAAILLLMGNVQNAITNAIALAGLATVCTLLLIPLTLIGSFGQTGAPYLGALALLAMAVPLVAFAGILLLMGNVQNAVTNAIVLAGLATVCTLLLIPLTIVGAFGLMGLPYLGALALLAMAVPLVAFAGILMLMGNVQNAVTNAMALATLATVCSLLLIPLTLIGAAGLAGLPFIGVLALLAMAVPMIAFVGILALMDNIKNATSNAELLINLMTAMTDMLVKVSMVAPLALVAVVAMDGLVLLIGKIGVVALALGALMEKFPSIETFLNKGLPMLEKLAGSIGTMIGKFIGNLGEALSDSLVKIGEDIAEFMDQLAKASESASTIKGESFDGIKSLMAVLLEIGGTSIGTGVMDKVSNFLSGKDSIDKFVSDAKKFFEGMKEAMSPLNGVTFNEEGLNCILRFAERLAAFESSLDGMYGFISWVTGRSDLDIFRKNAGEFFASMRDAMQELDGVTFNRDGLECVMDFAERLAALESSLDGLYGFMAWITGRTDLDIFRQNAKQFFNSMKETMQSLDNVTFNEEGLNYLMDFAERIAAFQSSLDGMYGFMAWCFGLTDLDLFRYNATQFFDSMKDMMSSLDNVYFNEESLNYLMTFAERIAAFQSSLDGMRNFMTWCTGLTDISVFGANAKLFIDAMKTAMSTLDGATFNEEAMTSIINAAERLASLQSKLEPIGGVVTWFNGRSDLGTFGERIGLFAEAMGKLSTSVGENGISADVVTSMTNAGNALIELQKALPEENWFDGKMNLSEFSKYITDFATSMSQFSEAANSIEQTAVTTAIDTANKIKDLITSLVGLDTSGLVAFTGIGTGGFGADGAAYKIAKTMSTYGDEVAGINCAAVSTSVSAATQLKLLIASLVGLDTSGIENFKIDTIASKMASYSQSVAGIDVETVSGSVTAANRLSTLISSLAGLDPSGVDNFRISSIGSSLSSYSASVATCDWSAVMSSIIAAKDLRLFIANLADIDTSGVGSFSSAIEELSGINVNGIVEAFSGVSEKMANVGSGLIDGLITGIESRSGAIKAAVSGVLTSLTDSIKTNALVFRSVGETIVTRLGAGITNKKAELSTTMSNVLTACATKVREKYESFYSAGSYLVDGLANGISENQFKVTARVTAMAQAALDAAREIFKIHSPSQAAYEIAQYLISGFSNGVTDSTGLGIDATSLFSDNILDNLKGSLGGALDGIDLGSISDASGIDLNGILSKLGLSDVADETLGMWSENTEAVKKFQEYLIALGYDLDQFGADGLLGPETSAAITEFQKAMHLDPSGVLDPDTMNSLSTAIERINNAGEGLDTESAREEMFALRESASETADATEESAGIIDECIASLDEATSDFEASGENNVEGYIISLINGETDAYNAGFGLGSSAVAGVNDGQDSHSPSRETMKSGNWLGEGLIIGIKQMGRSVYKASENMGQEATTGVSSAMSTILDALSSDMDEQPTIRPVVDLSDVKTGVNAISGMFDGTQSIGVQSNLSAINLAMNRKLQNGSNDDIISAINKLNDGLGANRGDTYNFAGITYDSGDEISEAVQTLVRAAKMGRRV